MRATTYRLTDEQARKARHAAERCLAFEESRNYPLGAAIVRHLYGNGPASEAIEALATYQNDDGGFGNGLEVDVQAPVSNPFAARLAMHVLLSLRDQPQSPLVAALTGWLNSMQDKDGDWHFAPSVYEAPLAPWFQGWDFPSVNPACCLAGLGKALGLLTPETLARTAALFARQGSIEQARTGDFYDVLPYVEYFGSIERPDRDAWLDAIAANIVETARQGKYEDASHFFDHALGAGPGLVQRLPADLLSEQTDRLLDEQAEDGGWPNPYSTDWRPFASAMAVATLARLHGAA